MEIVDDLDQELCALGLLARCLFRWSTITVSSHIFSSRPTDLQAYASPCPLVLSVLVSICPCHIGPCRASSTSHHPHYYPLPQSYLHLALWSFLSVWILMLIITSLGSLESLYCSASHECNTMKSSVVLLNGSCSLLLLPYAAALLRHGRPSHFWLLDTSLTKTCW